MRTVAGIDVGGPGKGFHVVALRPGEVLRPARRMLDVREVEAWCRAERVEVVGIDAPCRWREGDTARAAEREMAKAKIGSFLTPTRSAAHTARNDFYGWMFHGEAIYKALEMTHPLLDETIDASTGRCCFETFPHAVACALAGRVLRATDKRHDRRRLLVEAGIDVAPLTSIDWIDAALCALVARQLAAGEPCKRYGDATSGWIVVPGRG